MPPERVILIGNYRPDGQESMLRFANLLADGFGQRGFATEILAPPPILARTQVCTARGWRKWIGYIDKWILFPRKLRRTAVKILEDSGDNVRFHICDHSNAPYLAHLPQDRTAITCHDVLAIRGALGDAAAYCPASPTGVILQRWILGHLRRAKRIACVSQQTHRHLCEVAKAPAASCEWTVIHNALNADFKRIEPEEAGRILQRHGHIWTKPFLLHVGSSALRKNRGMLLRMVNLAGRRWQGNICFAGEPMGEDLIAQAGRLGLSNRVHEVTKPDHQTLCALYSLAHSVVLPSFSEGFGWPLVEAQACGAPVIASNIESLVEVSGGAALHADPDDAQGFVSSLFTLENETVRRTLQAGGLNNITRFSMDSMTDKYLALHRLEEMPSACSAAAG